MAVSDAFYNDIKLEVDALLADLGTTYSVRGQGSYDPATLSTEPAAAPRAVVGLVASEAASFNLGAQIFAVAATSANWANKKTLLLTAAANPAPKEEIQVDGQWFPLSKVVPIKPADVVLLYMLDVSV